MVRQSARQTHREEREREREREGERERERERERYVGHRLGRGRIEIKVIRMLHKLDSP